MTYNLEKFYVFFSISDNWYKVLNKQIMDLDNILQLRSLSKTRWTARVESTKAV